MSGAGVGKPIFHYTLAKNYELDVTDNGNPAPGHRGSPEGSVIGHTAGHGGKVLVGGGKQLEGNVGGEYFGWKRGGEEGGEARLQYAEGCCEEGTGQYLEPFQRGAE